MNWINFGKITTCPPSTFGGVYLLVHKGSYDRVIYVGTSSNIGRRACQHLLGYLRGNRTVWQVSQADDIYARMCGLHISNFIKYAKDLADQNLLWGATTIERISSPNLLAPTQTFDQNWHSFTENEFIPYVHVWGLKIDPYSALNSMLIESAIQQRLVKVFRLGGFFNDKRLSILGKIEFSHRQIRIRSAFSNVPNLDEASQIVFSSLDCKTIPEEAYRLAHVQLATVIENRLKKKITRQIGQQKVRDRYPNLGKPWAPVDIEKLRVMHTEFHMGVTEIGKILGRNSSGIRMMISRNERLFPHQWAVRPKAYR